MGLHTAAATLALLFGTAAFGEAPAEAWKCPPDASPAFADAPDFVFLLDGKAIDQARFDQLDRSSIESIDILCAKELHQAFGVKAKMSGVVAFTAPGPTAALEASLESIAGLQDKHLREHGAYTTDLARLGWNDESGLISIQLTVTDNGTRWVATARHQHRVGYAATQVGDKP